MLFAGVDLTHMFCVWVQVVDATAIAEGSRANAISLPSSNKDGGRVELPPPNRFAAALCGVLGNSALGDTFADVLLLAHHPLVCHSAKGAKSVWGGIGRRAFGGEEGIGNLLQDGAIAASVTARLVSAMQGQVKSDRCAFLFSRLYQIRNSARVFCSLEKFPKKTNGVAVVCPCCNGGSTGFLGRFMLRIRGFSLLASDS